MSSGHERPLSLPTAWAPIVETIADAEQPLVQLSFDESLPPVQLSVPVAAQLASDLQRACRAVEMDSFLLEWMLQSTYFNAGDAALLLDEFHNWRLERLAQRSRKTRGST